METIYILRSRFMIKCIICNTDCKNYIGLSTHIRKHNLTTKQYYDLYLKQENEGKCLICGKETKFRRISLGYNKCCNKCFNHSPLKVIHTKETNLKKYGVTCTLHTLEMENNVRKIILDKYGNETYFNSNDYKEKRIKKLNEKYNFIENNYINVFQIPEIKEKIKNTLISRTIDEKDATQQKRKETCLEKYGTEHWTKNKEWINNFQNNYYLKTGYYNPNQNPEIFNKRFSKYKYNNLYFDSSWELAYYIWLKDNNIEFKYHSGLYFEYTENNKIHKYYPDFILKDKIVEIKSDYLLNEKCKFKISEEKINCMKEHNVTIFCKNEIMTFLNYIKNKYGKDF